MGSLGSIGSTGAVAMLSLDRVLRRNMKREGGVAFKTRVTLEKVCKAVTDVAKPQTAN